MSDGEQIIQEELFIQNNTATLFHRTQTVGNIPSILERGWSARRGTYGTGIYTTYLIQDQFKSYMSGYGTVLLKFKYEGLDNLLIFSVDLAKKIHKDKFLLKDQIEKIAPSFELTEDNLKRIASIQEMLENSDFSSDAAHRFTDIFYGELKHFAGVEYYGRNDGHCVVIYPPAKNISLIAFAENAAISKNPDSLRWTKMGSKRVFSKSFKKGLFSDPEIKLSMPELETDKKMFPFLQYVNLTLNKAKANILDPEDIKKLFTYTDKEHIIFNIFNKINDKAPFNAAILSSFIKNFKSDAYKFEVYKILYKVNIIMALDMERGSSKYVPSTFENIKYFLTLDENQKAALPNMGQILANFISSIAINNPTDAILDFLRDKIVEYKLLNKWLLESSSRLVSPAKSILSRVFFKNNSSLSVLTEYLKINRFTRDAYLSLVDIVIANKDLLSSQMKDPVIINFMDAFINSNHDSAAFNLFSTKVGDLVSLFFANNPSKFTPQNVVSYISNLDVSQINLIEKVPLEMLKSIDVKQLSNIFADKIIKNVNDATISEKLWNQMERLEFQPSHFFNVYLKLLETRYVENDATQEWQKLFFKNYIVDLIQVIQIFEKVHYLHLSTPIIYNYLLKPEQFNKDIYVYVLFNVLYAPVQAQKFVETVEKQYPKFTERTFDVNVMSEYIEKLETNTNIDPLIGMLLNWFPKLIDQISVKTMREYLDMGFNSDYRGNYFNVLKKCIESDKFFNKNNDPKFMDKILEKALLYSTQILPDPIQSFEYVVSKIESVSPNFIFSIFSKPVSGYSNDFVSSFLDNLRYGNKTRYLKYFADYIINLVNVNMSARLIGTLTSAFSYVPSAEKYPEMFDKILDIKKDKLTKNELEALVKNEIDPSRSGNKYPQSPTPIEIITKYESVNPEYLEMLDGSVWNILLNNSKPNDVNKVINKMLLLKNKLDESIWYAAILRTPTPHLLIPKLIKYATDFSRSLPHAILQKTVDRNIINQLFDGFKIDEMNIDNLVDLFNRYIPDEESSPISKSLLSTRIFNRLNFLTEDDQLAFLNNMTGKSTTKTAYNFNYLKFAAKIRNLNSEMMTTLLNYITQYYDDRDYTALFESGPQALLTTLLRYNQKEGYNIELFFNALRSDKIKYLTDTGLFVANISKLIDITLVTLKSNINDKIATVLLNEAAQLQDTDYYKQLVKKLLSSEYRGDTLTGPLIGFILNQAFEIYTDPQWSQYLITEILNKTKNNITDNMAFNLIQFAKDKQFVSGGRGGNLANYVANVIFKFRKDSLTASLIHNLLGSFYTTSDNKLSLNKVSLMEMIYKILSIKSNNLSFEELRIILVYTPLDKLYLVLKVLKPLYNTVQIQQILFSKYKDDADRAKILQLLA